MDEGGGSPSWPAACDAHLLDKPFNNPLCGMGIGMTKEQQAVASGASCWSMPAAAGILAELIPVTISERIDLKSTLR